MNYRRRTIFLSILWLASYISLYISLYVYIFAITAWKGSFASNNLPDEYLHFSLLAVLFYFLPLAFWVHTSSRKAGMRTLKIISMIAMIFLAVWSSLGFIAFIIKEVN